MSDITVKDTNSELDRIAQLIYYFVGALNALLLLRLLFKAFGANPGSGIVQLIYNLTNLLLVPFKGIFDVAAAGEMVIEPAILVAMLIYTLLARGIVELMYIISKKYG